VPVGAHILTGDAARDSNAPAGGGYTIPCTLRWAHETFSCVLGVARRQAVLIWIDARKRMHQVPSGKMVAAPTRKQSKAAR
jgi:hypothetical protein